MLSNGGQSHFDLYKGMALIRVIRVMEYADLRPNKSLCLQYAEAMESLGSPVLCQTDREAPGPGSTDQGKSLPLRLYIYTHIAFSQERVISSLK
jgi:hypothetical protein